MDERVKLGDLARDRISGFEGVVIARTEWLRQCDRYTLAPTKLDEKGRPQDPATFDEGDIEVIEEDYLGDAPEERPTNGGPRPEPVRRT